MLSLVWAQNAYWLGAAMGSACAGPHFSNAAQYVGKRTSPLPAAGSPFPRYCLVGKAGARIAEIGRHGACFICGPNRSAHRRVVRRIDAVVRR